MEKRYLRKRGLKPVSTKVLIPLLALSVGAILYTAAIHRTTALNLDNAIGGGQVDHLLEKYNVYPYPIDPAARVVNPNPVLWGTWDINDQPTFQVDGSLGAGASTDTVRKIVWGYNPMHVSKRGELAWWSFPSSWYGIRVLTPSPRLVIQMCFSPQNRCFTIPATKVDQGFIYSLCAQVVYTPTDPALTLIPGSTPDVLPVGSVPGMGVPSTVTLSITNPTFKSIRNVSVGFGVTSDQGFSPGCSSTHETEQHDYPFNWYP